MDITPEVVSVRALDDVRLEVGFGNGETREFDIRPYLEYPLFQPLKNPAEFRRARVAHGTVVWSDTIDPGPDTLYLRGKRVAGAAEPTASI